MPLYEYKCPECGEAIELIAHVREIPPSCPDCGAAMEKQISVPGPPRIR